MGSLVGKRATDRWGHFGLAVRAVAAMERWWAAMRHDNDLLLLAHISNVVFLSLGAAAVYFFNGHAALYIIVGYIIIAATAWDRRYD